jgi:CheY-like chemotaxis protein
VVRNLVTNACKFTHEGGTIAIEGEVLPTAQAATQGASNGGRSLNGNLKKLIEESVPSFEATQATRCGCLRVKVRDTGVGIKEHNKDKLFHQFQQFDKNQLQSGGGSGLGLWISHYIVDCHGGKLQFESIGSGKGSVFFFDLPLYHEQKSTVPPMPAIKMVQWPGPAANAATKVQSLAVEEGRNLEVEPRDPGAVARTTRVASADSYPQPRVALLDSGPAYTLPGVVSGSSVAPDHHTDKADDTARKRVSFLLVDDSKGNRRMLRRMLESDKSIPVSSVQEAEDGVDAVKIVAEAGSAPDKPPIDCIFMDSVMKEMHGPETVEHLRRKLKYTGKILGLTGNAMEDDVKHFKEAGLDVLLTKPLKTAALLEALAAQGLIPTSNIVSKSVKKRI